MPGLPGARHHDVQLPGVRLHLAELGPPDGLPLLLVHGWPQSWWCWHRVAPLLADDFRCLMPDLRGHGWSDAPREGYDKRQLAKDLLGLLDALGLDRVAYAGHDWGAFVGFLLGLRAPDRLSGVLALSIPHLWPSLHDRVNPLRLAFAYQLPLSTPLLGERLMRAGLTKAILRGGAPAGTFSDDEVELYDRCMRTPDGARVTTSMYRTFLLREFPALAAGRYAPGRLTLPTRLVVGEKDPIVRGADLEGYETHATDMSVERVPDAGHFLPDERPELVADRARSLFA
jgi:pimeloyl-ACP methyl ester carboxylesterase